LGWRTLQEEVESLGGADAPDTRLHVDLAGRDPDEGMTEIPYEKGAAFLRTIEAAVGRERWDEYLRAYFERHALQPMTTEGFLQDLRTHLIAGDTALENRLQLEEWAYGTGVPDNAVVPRSDAFAAVEAQAQAFTSGTPAPELETAEWSTQEWLHFLGVLPRELTREQLQDLDRTFALSSEGNSELLFAWLRLAVDNRDDQAITSPGR